MTDPTLLQSRISTIHKLVTQPNDDVAVDFGDGQETLRFISSYSPEIIAKIDEYLQPHDESKAHETRVHHLRRMIIAELPENAINEQLSFLPLLGEAETYWAEELLGSLHEYPQLPESEDYSRESQLVINQCIALMKTAYVLIKFDIDIYGVTSRDLVDDDWMIADEKLTEVVLANPERVDQITAFIVNRRQKPNAELIQEMLDSSSPALSDGLL